MNRPEGWADRPGDGAGLNPLGLAGPARGTGGSTPFAGKVGTATAMRPGASAPGAGIGGSAGSYGGIGIPVAGMPGSSGGAGAGLGPAIITSTGGGGVGIGWHAQPGQPGGAGDGPGGMMPSGPRRPGLPGSTTDGPPGTAIGLRPGGAPNVAGSPFNGGGVPGTPGMPFAGGDGPPDGVPTAGASGGIPHGLPGAGDRPGAGGEPGTGIGGVGPRVGKPSYGAAALSGPTPSYPRVARTENVTGTVILEVFLNPKGDVVRVDFLQRSPADILDNEARRTVMKWQYRRAMVDGQFVAGSVKFSITYSADSEPIIKELP